MKLSNRILDLAGGGDAWAVYFAARKIKAAGEDVIELSVGEHDFPTPKPILDAMATAAYGGHTGYAEIPGVAALRAAIARRVSDSTGVATGPGNVLVTPGGQSALFAAHSAVLEPGETGLYIDPYYATYPGTIRAAGGVPIPVAARPEDGFRPNVRDIAEVAAQTRARSLLINTPNNPTGAIYGPDTLAAIGEVCTARDLWLISDEVYDTMVWTGRHVSPRSLPGLTERTLVVGSMSKSFAMTGSRVGWIVGPEEVIFHLSNLAIHTTYGVPGYIQDAAVFALGAGAALESEVCAPFRRRRDLARALLDRQNLVRSIPAEGAMYLLLDIRATGLSGTAFAQALLDAERIAVMPGESFGQAAAGHVRVALTVDDDSLRDALTRLIEFARSRAG